MKTPTLEQLEAATIDFNSNVEPQIYNSTKKRRDTIEAVRFALAFTAKAMGNLSQDAIQAGIDSYNRNGNLAIVAHYKAMIDQIVKECEES